MFFYRLTDGPNPKSGRVEVKHNGVWGTICDDNFGENESQVICRMLGFSSNVGRIYNESISAYQGNGPIWVRYGLTFFKTIIGGFPIEIKTKIRYLIICCYHIFIR